MNTPDDVVREIWKRWFKFYTDHFRAASLPLSYADQMAFYEIAEPLVRGMAMLKYNWNKDYPKGQEPFVGLYIHTETGKLGPVIIRRADHPMGGGSQVPLHFITEHGGPPHYVVDPVAWAPLPEISEPRETPIEHSISKVGPGNAVPPDMMHRLELQKREFETLDMLVEALKRLPPVVDDDYPQMRWAYDRALMEFLRACQANGRMKRLPKTKDSEE